MKCFLKSTPPTYRFCSTTSHCSSDLSCMGGSSNKAKTQLIHSNHKSSLLGYPYFRKPQNVDQLRSSLPNDTLVRNPHCGIGAQDMLVISKADLGIVACKAGGCVEGCMADWMLIVPSGHDWHSYWKWPFISFILIFPMIIVIFHSYVKLPEDSGVVDESMDEFGWSLVCCTP